MSKDPVLTIAVPTYNKGEFLARNLESIAASHCENIEVLVLDNSSTDDSGEIAEAYAKEYPHLFTVIHKENKGYGSSVNLAIEKARGRYLRILDADDWVDPQALAELAAQLDTQQADILLMSYRKVDINTGEELLLSSAPAEWRAGEVHFQFSEETCPVPQLHGTVFGVDFLRKAEITLLENAYYVDEQLMLWTYMSAESASKMELDVYRYSVGSEMQSVSAHNMGLHWREREDVIRSCIERQMLLEKNGGLRRACTMQLAINTGNHFTTLYMYVQPRKYGRTKAKEWQSFLQNNTPGLWALVRFKARLLSVLCAVHVSPKLYEKMKSNPILRRFV